MGTLRRAHRAVTAYHSRQWEPSNKAGPAPRLCTKSRDAAADISGPRGAGWAFSTRPNVGTALAARGSGSRASPTRWPERKSHRYQPERQVERLLPEVLRRRRLETCSRRLRPELGTCSRLQEKASIVPDNAVVTALIEKRRPMAAGLQAESPLTRNNDVEISHVEPR